MYTRFRRAYTPKGLPLTIRWDLHITSRNQFWRKEIIKCRQYITVPHFSHSSRYHSISCRNGILWIWAPETSHWNVTPSSRRPPSARPGREAVCRLFFSLAGYTYHRGVSGPRPTDEIELGSCDTDSVCALGEVGLHVFKFNMCILTK